jgi:hypothetical protein
MKHLLNIALYCTIIAAGRLKFFTGCADGYLSAWRRFLRRCEVSKLFGLGKFISTVFCKFGAVSLVVLSWLVLEAQPGHCRRLLRVTTEHPPVGAWNGVVEYLRGFGNLQGFQNLQWPQDWRAGDGGDAPGLGGWLEVARYLRVLRDWLDNFLCPSEDDSDDEPWVSEDGSDDGPWVSEESGDDHGSSEESCDGALEPDNLLRIIMYLREFRDWINSFLDVGGNGHDDEPLGSEDGHDDEPWVSEDGSDDDQMLMQGLMDSDVNAREWGGGVDVCALELGDWLEMIRYLHGLRERLMALGVGWR